MCHMLHVTCHVTCHVSQVTCQRMAIWNKVYIRFSVICLPLKTNLQCTFPDLPDQNFSIVVKWSDSLCLRGLNLPLTEEGRGLSRWWQLGPLVYPSLFWFKFMANKQFRMEKKVWNISVRSQKPIRSVFIWKNHSRKKIWMVILVFLYVFGSNLAPEHCFLD